MVEVYVNDFMSLVIPLSQDQLHHVGNAIMHGVHDVFPRDNVDSNNPISEKKLAKGEGTYLMRKTLLRFDFNGETKTMWLEEAKRVLSVFVFWKRKIK